MFKLAYGRKENLRSATQKMPEMNPKVLPLDKLVRLLDQGILAYYLEQVALFLGNSKRELWFPNLSAELDAFLVRITRDVQNIKDLMRHFDGASRKHAEQIVKLLKENEEVYQLSYSYELYELRTHVLVYRKAFLNKRTATEKVTEEISPSTSQKDPPDRKPGDPPLPRHSRSFKTQWLAITLAFIKDDSRQSMDYPEMSYNEANYIYSLLRRQKMEESDPLYRELCDALKEFSLTHEMGTSFLYVSGDKVHLCVEKRPLQKKQEETKQIPHNTSKSSEDSDPKLTKNQKRKRLLDSLEKSFVNTTLKMILDFICNEAEASLVFRNANDEQCTFIQAACSMAKAKGSYGLFGEDSRVLLRCIAGSLAANQQFELKIEVAKMQKNQVLRTVSLKKEPTFKRSLESNINFQPASTPKAKTVDAPQTTEKVKETAPPKNQVETPSAKYTKDSVTKDVIIDTKANVKIEDVTVKKDNESATIKIRDSVTKDVIVDTEANVKIEDVTVKKDRESARIEDVDSNIVVAGPTTNDINTAVANNINDIKCLIAAARVNVGRQIPTIVNGTKVVVNTRPVKVIMPVGGEKDDAKKVASSGIDTLIVPSTSKDTNVSSGSKSDDALNVPSTSKSVAALNLPSTSKNTSEAYTSEVEKDLVKVLPLCVRKTKLLQAMSVPMESDIGMRMMRLMGWHGGPLGVRGEGIVEPLVPALHLSAGAGLGHTKPEKEKEKEKKKKEKLKRETSAYIVLLKEISLLLNQDNATRVIQYSTPLKKSEKKFLKSILQSFSNRQRVETNDSLKALVEAIMEDLAFMSDVVLDCKISSDKRSLTLIKSCAPTSTTTKQAPKRNEPSHEIVDTNTKIPDPLTEELTQRLGDQYSDAVNAKTRQKLGHRIAVLCRMRSFVNEQSLEASLGFCYKLTKKQIRFANEAVLRINGGGKGCFGTDIEVQIVEDIRRVAKGVELGVRIEGKQKMVLRKTFKQQALTLSAKEISDIANNNNSTKCKPPESVASQQKPTKAVGSEREVEDKAVVETKETKATPVGKEDLNEKSDFESELRALTAAIQQSGYFASETESSVGSSSKRSRSESENSDKIVKRAKSDKMATFVRITSAEKPVAEVAFDFQGVINEKLDFSTELPLLECRGVEQDALVYACYNDLGVLLVESVASELNLKTTIGDVTPKNRHLIRFKMNSFVGVNLKKLFGRIERYNKDLSTELWTVNDVSTHGEYVVVEVEIDEPSLEYIQENRFCVFAGADRLRCSLVWN